MVRYKKGHKNSKGEKAPWTIVSCKTGKILSSHKTKEAAKEHLQQMEYYKHAKQESVDTPVTEGVKDYLLAGALALSPMVGHAATGDQHAEELPAVSVEQLKTLKFNPHVKYKLTPQQYQILSASGNLPVDYIVPKPKSDTAKTVAKKAETPKTEPVKAEQPKKVAQSGDDASCGALCHLGKAAGAGAKSVWNGIKSFASGVADGWNKNESVSEFQQWLGEQPKTPLTEAVQQMYTTLFESSNDDWWNDDVFGKELDPAEAKAFEAAKSLFVPANGQESKMISQIKKMWDDELSCCGADITDVEDYDPSDGLMPEISISFTDLDGDRGTLLVRADDKGRLSYVIRDENGKNMNPYLYKFEGKDLNQFEDRYECSPKYEIAKIDELLDEIMSKILLYGNLNREFLMRK